MKKEMKRKGLRAVLCGLAVMLACMMLPVTSYAYTQRDHPSTVLTPDGLGWTLYDPLPVTDYDVWPAPFWEPVSEHDKLVTTGQALNLVADKAGVGEHVYKYERHGEVPVYAWQLKHETSICCQANYTQKIKCILKLEHVHAIIYILIAMLMEYFSTFKGLTKQQI